MKEFRVFSFSFPEDNVNLYVVNGLQKVIPSHYFEDREDKKFKLTVSPDGNIEIKVESEFDEDSDVERLKRFMLALEDLRA